MLWREPCHQSHPNHITPTKRTPLNGGIQEKVSCSQDYAELSKGTTSPTSITSGRVPFGWGGWGRGNPCPVFGGQGSTAYQGPGVPGLVGKERCASSPGCSGQPGTYRLSAIPPPSSPTGTDPVTPVPGGCRGVEFIATKEKGLPGWGGRGSCVSW